MPASDEEIVAKASELETASTILGQLKTELASIEPKVIALQGQIGQQQATVNQLRAELRVLLNQP